MTIRVVHCAKSVYKIFYSDFSHCYTPQDFTKWKILKFFWNLLWGQADCSFILWFIVWSIFGNTFLKKVTNKSLSKQAVKVMRDRKGPYLSFDTPKIQIWPCIMSRMGESKSQIRSWLKAIISFGTLFWNSY